MVPQNLYAKRDILPQKNTYKQKEQQQNPYASLMLLHD